jgi:hypothetical protein
MESKGSLYMKNKSLLKGHFTKANIQAEKTAWDINNSQAKNYFLLRIWHGKAI